jgi:hypothetical protein
MTPMTANVKGDSEDLGGQNDRTATEEEEAEVFRK